MTAFQVVHDQLVWGTCALFYASLLWPAVVAPFWPWWQEWWGRNLVLFDLGVAVTLFPSWLSITFHIHIGVSIFWSYVALVGIYLVILNIVWRTALVIVTQVKGARRDREREREKT